MQPVAATGYVDNDAVRLAVARGSSLALGHLGKHGEVNFRYLSQCGIVLKRVDTADNIAEIFTKVLSAQKMNHLLRGLLEPEVEPESRAVVAPGAPARRRTPLTWDRRRCRWSAHVRAPESPTACP